MYWTLAFLLALQVSLRSCRNTDHSLHTAAEELEPSEVEPHLNRDVSKILIPLRGADIESKNPIKFLSKELKHKKQLVEIVPIKRKGNVEKSLAYILAPPKVSKKHRNVSRLEERSRSEELNESGNNSDELSGDMHTEDDEELSYDIIGSYLLPSVSQEDISSEEINSDGTKRTDKRKSGHHVLEVRDDNNSVEVQQKSQYYPIRYHHEIDSATKDHHHVRSRESEDSKSDISIKSETKYDFSDSIQDNYDTKSGSRDSDGTSANISGAHNVIQDAYDDTNDAKLNGHLVNSQEESGHRVYIDTNYYSDSIDVSNNLQEMGTDTFSNEHLERADSKNDYSDKDMRVEDVFIERNGDVEIKYDNNDFLQKITTPEKDLIEFVEASSKQFGDKYEVLKGKNDTKSRGWHHHQFKNYQMSFIFNR